VPERGRATATKSASSARLIASLGSGTDRSQLRPISLPAVPHTVARPAHRTLLLAAAVAVIATLFATDYAHPAQTPDRSQRLDTRAHRGQPKTGTIVFKGDFEPGNLSQWTWGAQCVNTGVPSSSLAVRGTITVQSEAVAQGRYGARIDLPAAPGNKSACETLSKRRIGVGTHDYYGMMVRFPPGWREPSSVGWGLSIAQFNFQNIWGAPVMLLAHANHIALVLQSGHCRGVFTSNPGCAYSSGPGGNVRRLAAVRAPLALDAWHELIIHVRWATNSSGVLEVWHRLMGSRTWNKTASLRGYPTLQWTADKGRRAIVRSVTSDKIGAYRGQADFPLTVWHDGFVRGRSFAATAAALP
jgi:Polysaccharide lyase